MLSGAREQGRCHVQNPWGWVCLESRLRKGPLVSEAARGHLYSRAGGGRDGAGAPPGAGCRTLAVLLRVVPLTRRAAVPAPPRPPASVRLTGPDDFDLIAPLITSWPPPHSLQLSQCFYAACSGLLPIFLWGFCLFLVSLQECNVYFNCESFVSFSHCGYFLLLY